MTEDFFEAWAVETSRVQEENPLLTWEACEMIAYRNLTKKVDHESRDR